MKKSLVALFLIISFSPIYSQSADSVIKQFRETFQKKYFSVGAYIQTIGDFQAERTSGTNGFTLSNARIKLYGEFDEGFGYYLQANFVITRPILDAYVYHKFSDALRLDIGQYKAPFSGEYLTSSTLIDFVLRSQAANLLGPKRQVGLQAKGNIAEGIFTYAVGIFNGNGMNTRNDNDHFLYSGRVTVSPKISGGKLTFGANAAFSKDTEEEENLDRFLAGADFRFENEHLIFSAEFIQQNLEYDDELSTEDKDNGFHFTAGYKINKELQVLARYDSYNYIEDDDANNLIIAGLNFFPTEITKFQFNYVINTDDSDIDHNQILLKAQIAF